ncbi:MAG TPA: YqgE/AlgH family protein [Gammaproteobacteria bacterium]|nr:YqgE/AlgH family protein [Gammaproteobacteria bacterium]
MAESGYLKNQFLIAMPTLQDPNFFHSVAYICEHNENGAMAIVINQPVDLTVGELIEQMKHVSPKTPLANSPVFRGGPVDVDRGFVLHPTDQQWEATLPVTDKIALTTSNDIITAMAEGRGPEKSLVALGYAGWGAGQLEEEIRDNAWLNVPANTELLFDTEVDKRWEAAASLLGVDIHQLTGDAGHA